MSDRQKESLARKADEIVVFSSTHQALKAEDALRAVAAAFELVPLPKRFTAECGLAIRFNRRTLPDIEDVFKRHAVKYKGIYVSEADD